MSNNDDLRYPRPDRDSIHGSGQPIADPGRQSLDPNQPPPDLRTSAGRPSFEQSNYQAGASQPRFETAPREINRRSTAPDASPTIGRSLWIIGAIGVGLIVAGLGALLIVFMTGLGGSGDTSSNEARAVLTPDETGDRAGQARELLDAIGYTDINVADVNGTMVLTGSVPTTADRTRATAAIESMADVSLVDSSGLVVSEPTSSSATTDGDGGAATPKANQLQLMQLELNRASALNPIIFETSNTLVESWHEPTLERVAKILTDNPGVSVDIIGFADLTGSSGNNEALSLRRATAVRDNLVKQGVDTRVLNVVARGESESSGLRDISYLERRVGFEVIAATEMTDLPPVSIGVIVPSAANDLAFSQSLIDALAILDSERGGITTTVNENMFDVDEARSQAREYASDGLDVVILHGAQFVPIVEELALEFPNTTFLTGPAEFETSTPNVFGYSVAAEEGAYVMGDLAGKLTQSGTVSLIGPVEASEPTRYVNGFRQGAETQGATALVDYTGSFGDVELATQVANDHVAKGADVASGTAQMTVGPIRVVEEQGGLWFGNQSNQAELAPNSVVASQVYHIEVALREIFAAVDAGAPGGLNFNLTLGNGGLLLEFNPNVPITTAQRDEVDRLLFAIAAGTVEVG